MASSALTAAAARAKGLLGMVRRPQAHHAFLPSKEGQLLLLHLNLEGFQGPLADSLRAMSLVLVTRQRSCTRRALEGHGFTVQCETSSHATLEVVAQPEPKRLDSKKGVIPRGPAFLPIPGEHLLIIY